MLKKPFITSLNILFPLSLGLFLVPFFCFLSDVLNLVGVYFHLFLIVRIGSICLGCCSILDICKGSVIILLLNLEHVPVFK